MALHMHLSCMTDQSNQSHLSLASFAGVAGVAFRQISSQMADMQAPNKLATPPMLDSHIQIEDKAAVCIQLT